jgi:hypothetical protein
LHRKPQLGGAAYRDFETGRTKCRTSAGKQRPAADACRRSGGKLAGGRHIALPQATPLSNLHLSVLALAGIEQQTFGDSTGSIAL